MERVLRSSLNLAAVFVLAVLAMIPAATPASAEAPPWGACGWRTPEDKLVREFTTETPTVRYRLLCGNENKGYRHILARHRLDFERMAAGTNTNWRDVADLAMDTMLKDPDDLKPARGDQTCRTRVLFLKNLRNNQVVRQQQFKMFTFNGSNEIATAFPDNRGCE